jgi:hypothetical protein
MKGWNTTRFEETRKADKLAADTLAKHREWEEKEAAREKLVRLEFKRQIKVYQKVRAREQAAIEEAEQRATALAAELLADQAELNEERVEFRQGVADARQREAELVARQLLAEHAARERRLADLRATVQVTAQRDAERTFGHTQASRAAAAAGADLRDHRYLEQLEGNTRSFVNHGFSAAQIGADKRVKVEAALRAAGLAGSDYARQALQRVQPPTAPRADMASTVFRSDPPA